MVLLKNSKMKLKKCLLINQNINLKIWKKKLMML